MGEDSCVKCGQIGHKPNDCKEKRFSKLWPGDFIFRGKFRTPGGFTAEFEMPLGAHGQRLIDEFASIAATGEPVRVGNSQSNEERAAWVELIKAEREYSDYIQQSPMSLSRADLLLDVVKKKRGVLIGLGVDPNVFQ